MPSTTVFLRPQPFKVIVPKFVRNSDPYICNVKPALSLSLCLSLSLSLSLSLYFSLLFVRLFVCSFFRSFVLSFFLLSPFLSLFFFSLSLSVFLSQSHSLSLSLQSCARGVAPHAVLETRLRCTECSRIASNYLLHAHDAT